MIFPDFPVLNLLTLQTSNTTNALMSQEVGKKGLYVIRFNKNFEILENLQHQILSGGSRAYPGSTGLRWEYTLDD